MKKHKTFNRQLGILRERGMTVPTSSKKFLVEENYYNVINGYKDLFLKVDQDGESLDPEEYIKGTHFNELKNLFLFDRELRNIVLKYILIFENSLKTTIAYEFSKKYKSKNSYLDIKNFKEEPKKVLQQISILTKTIHDKVDKYGAVKHYIEKHGEVPLWVLVNYLTIGNISNFYNVLKESDRNIISKTYADRYNKNYKSSVRLQDLDFAAGLKVINLTRNICAHDERLYNFNFKNTRMSSIANNLAVRNYDNRKVVVVILFLKMVLNKKYFNTFITDFLKLCKKYENSFKTVSFDKILEIMGILDINEIKNLK